MAAIDDISKAMRELTPDEIRDRLAQIDSETRILRALLRAATRDRKPPKPQQGDQS